MLKPGLHLIDSPVGGVVAHSWQVDRSKHLRKILRALRVRPESFEGSGSGSRGGGFSPRGLMGGLGKFTSLGWEGGPTPGKAGKQSDAARPRSCFWEKTGCTKTIEDSLSHETKCLETPWALSLNAWQSPLSPDSQTKGQTAVAGEKACDQHKGSLGFSGAFQSGSRSFFTKHCGQSLFGYREALIVGLSPWVVLSQLAAKFLLA